TEVFPGGFFCQAGEGGIAKHNLRPHETSVKPLSCTFQKRPSTCDFRRGFGRTTSQQSTYEKGYSDRHELPCLGSAYLLKPEIAKRLVVIWIGGPEYPDMAPTPPDVGKYEYNQRIDPLSVQVAFNDSDLQLWQVPRSSYRECLISYAEILTKVKPMGAIGSFLYDNIVNIYKWRSNSPPGLGETYILGDQPLVTLTALQASFHPEPSSSTFVTRPAPIINEARSHEDNSKGRQIRIYTHTDVRLTFDDFFEKLALFAKS